MQLEPWQTHVKQIFRFFNAVQCCSCRKSYVFESVWFVRKSETLYGDRGLAVCQNCASTAKEAYTIAMRGSTRIKPSLKPSLKPKKDAWELVREVERRAADLGHNLGYPESNGAASYRFIMRCKNCGATVKIVDAPLPDQDYLVGDLCNVACTTQGT